MPATFPSHAAAVLPVKLWRPRWFDGVALVVGSMSPDLSYPLAGLVSMPETHTVAGLFWWALPVTVVVARVIRWAAPVVAAHLPAGPAWLAPRDYGVLGTVRHRLPVTVASALLAAASHLLWDGFTHHPDGHGWAVDLLPVLEPWYAVIQHLSSLLGAVVAVAVAVHIGRRRLLVAWHGPAPAARTVRRVFWGTAAAVALVYPLTWAMLPFRASAHVQGVRLLWAVGLGLLAGVVAVRVALPAVRRQGRIGA